MNTQAVRVIDLAQRRAPVPHLSADMLAGLTPQRARPPHGIRRLRPWLVERGREARVVRVAPDFPAAHFPLRESDALKLGLQLMDAARQCVDLALFTDQLGFDPLEAGRQPLVALVLGVDNLLLMPAQDALEVGELPDQILDEANSRLCPFVVKLVKLSACQRKRQHRKAPSSGHVRCEKRLLLPNNPAPVPPN